MPETPNRAWGISAQPVRIPEDPETTSPNFVPSAEKGYTGSTFVDLLGRCFQVSGIPLEGHNAENPLDPSIPRCKLLLSLNPKPER